MPYVFNGFGGPSTSPLRAFRAGLGIAEPREPREPRETGAVQAGSMTSARPPAPSAPMFSSGPCPPGFHKINVGTRSEACAPDVAAPIAVNPASSNPFTSGALTVALAAKAGAVVSAPAAVPAVTPTAAAVSDVQAAGTRSDGFNANAWTQPQALPVSTVQPAVTVSVSSAPPSSAFPEALSAVAPSISPSTPPASGGGTAILAAAGAGFFLGGPVGAAIGAGAGWLFARKKAS
jgi:hypothetical protein